MRARWGLLAVAGLLCAATESHAASEFDSTPPFDSKAHARGVTCSVSAVNLDFGNYDPFRRGHDDSTGHVAVTCRGRRGEAVAYSIALSAGGARAFAPRRMRFGSKSALNYNIYTSAARSVVWGDGNGGTVVVSDSFALRASRVTKHYPIYGRIFRSQNVPVGVYTDSIVVTLNF